MSFFAALFLSSVFFLNFLLDFLQVEVVIREQNMLDAYAMIENYFHLLVERVVLIQNNKLVSYLAFSSS